jgi:hypothetical protein
MTVIIIELLIKKVIKETKTRKQKDSRRSKVK